MLHPLLCNMFVVGPPRARAARTDVGHCLLLGIGDASIAPRSSGSLGRPP